MKPTRGGVYYSLKDSVYTHAVGDLLLYFSSKYHLEKFQDNFEYHKEEVGRAILRKWGAIVDVRYIAAISLYLSVETRGFYVRVDGRECRCPDEVTLSGLIPKLKD